MRPASTQDGNALFFTCFLAVLPLTRCPLETLNAPRWEQLRMRTTKSKRCKSNSHILCNTAAMVPNNLPALIRPVWVRRVDIISNHFEKFMSLY